MNEQTRRQRTAIALGVILLAAALLRTVFLVQLAGSPLGGVEPLDARFYRETASALAAGEGMPAGPLTFNPLYPVFLSVIFRLFGDGMLLPRIVNALLGTATVLLVFAAARRLAGGVAGGGRADLAALLAAAGAALYPQFPLYEGSLLATSLVTFLAAAAFLLALGIDEALGGGGRAGFLGLGRLRAGRGSVALEGALLFLGLVLGLGLLGRPNLFGLVLPLLVFRFVALAARRRAGDGERRGSRRLRRGLAVACLLLAGAILPGIPAAIHNARSGGPPLPLPAHGGINLYTGNRPGGTGVYDPPAGMRGDMRGLIEDARRIASREAGRPLDDAEASAFWAARAREAIAADPGGWLALLGRKILVYWSGDEVPDILDIRIYRRYCPALDWAIVGFVVISPLCLLGLWTVRRRRGRWIAWLFVAAALGSILPFFVNSRYRVPAVPVFLAVGGVAAAWLAGRAVARDWRRLAAGAVALALLFVFVSTPARVRVDPSASYTFLGNSHARDGDLEAAAEAFRTALELRPGVETRINYARVLSRLGKRKDAAFLYAAAFEENPDFPNLALEYGNLLEEAGRTADARQLYLYAWESDRTRERLVACKLLSRLAWAAGDVDEAVRWLEAGLEVAPGDKGLLETLQRIERR